VGETDSGSHPWCVLLWLPRITGARRHAGREIRRQVGAGGVRLSVNCQHFADADRCSFQLCTSHHSTHSLWHRIGMFHLYAISFDLGVFMPPGKSWIFSLNFPGRGMELSAK